MSVNLWEGFLPAKALVMGKARQKMPGAGTEIPNETEAAAEAETESETVGFTVEGGGKSETLERVAAELQGCTRCKLSGGRKTIVFGEGNPHAELVFVGEGPGEQEDIQGRPFVGKAGQLLDRMIEAIGLKREDVYIANVIKCRPPGNRNPEPDEIEQCSPFLYRQLDLIRPKVVVGLGKFAVQTLLQTDEGITRIRGKFRPYRGAKLMPTFHPAYLLRNPESKREAWLDLQAVAQELGLKVRGGAKGGEQSS